MELPRGEVKEGGRAPHLAGGAGGGAPRLLAVAALARRPRMVQAVGLTDRECDGEERMMSATRPPNVPPGTASRATVAPAGSAPGAHARRPAAGDARGSQGARGAPGAVCLLVHGRGQEPGDIERMVAGRLSLPAIRWITPAAEGKSWYAARAVDPLTPATRARMAAGLAVLDAAHAAARAAHPGLPVVVAGFSQGACLAAEWVLRGAEVDGLALFTGCRVGAFDPGEPARDLGGLPVYASCGMPDTWIPLSAFMALCALLGARGARLRADVFPGRPHEIGPAELAALAEMLASLTAAPIAPA